MTTSAVGLSARVGRKWLMALLAPALIIGIVLMHSLLLEPAAGADDGSHAEAVMATSQDHAAHASEMAMVGAAGHEDPGGHGTEGGMSDCSGLMAMCLALLVSFAAFIGWPRATSLWVLWQRPPPTFIRMGQAREAFLVMPTRQRTTVIRC